jgi:hypothetical protein
LSLYKKALRIWNRWYVYRLKYLGFCEYFYRKEGIDVYLTGFKSALPELYAQRKTEGQFHYEGNGRNKIGRQQRVEALRKAIALTESKIKSGEG